ncbi:NADH-quinone oxidoreductase subunit NuoF [Defluviitalea raffinosedens]|uniref:NADH-quinone oxidoreductase subunit NuoF n=1 Tax=Defluviitalea raffinosedens TaxID=1450156 RepID=A0A7C8HHE2_9FIRM|nr:NADH-quinone oxidoreductase subunit NuoF [Defluviitalea raffinosedens]KAE9636953.1 NADH-quinone oxidoreductase subunit NuoF [Defluviitalea raffinosedens]MBM7685296.1 NADH:ubiquinone oxidoreductase subunit F (NADH-binding)/(2Fe-2S) ferredoxin/NAD-dependent dihydropyrimidine dehydrogenase PreA subunit [Defluviitalea raffinosedens]HHW67265.1 NADH-quinone oxidoreductase subunit NuoF [Candidatus Epulonipiscium sp.]
MSKYKMHVLVCGGTGCISSNSTQIVDNIKALLKENGMENDVQVLKTGCFGFCEKGPIVKILPDNTFYVQVKPEDAEVIVKEHLIKGRKVDQLLYKEPATDQSIEDSKHMDFYKKQMRIALRNCGFIDPDNIDEYIARDGYQALGKALTEMTPESVIEEMKKSGLRGRGGGGFPTGLKWEFAHKNQSDQKYVVCNADEGDPGAFMDRSILEGDPHSVVEAMAICGYAIGASQGLVYIRAEYPLAVRRLKKAIEDARAYGLLGKDILGTGFDFDIEIKYGAGAFVCGEETALIHSMEGERGEPTTKPPFPAESGFWGKPTNVNNVETFANVPVILLKGADWFSSIGTEKSKGTKVFALAGKVNNVGLIEVPMGTTLREVIFDIGGGIKGGKKFKAVQTGGPSGGCLTEKDLDTPIDFDNLLEKGSMMGSGGMIVMDEDNCMPSVAKFYLEFTEDESCGKCTPCRVGTKRLSELLTKITEGKGTMEDLETLKSLSQIIKDTALCGLGQTAPNPVLSTIDTFWDEYVAHVKEHRCPAGQCSALLRYFILEDKCIGCTACSRVCPVGAISGKVKSTHVIDQDKCIKCGACFEKCKFSAIIKK